MAHPEISVDLRTSWDNYDREARKQVGNSWKGAAALIGKFSLAIQIAVERLEESQFFSSLVNSVRHEVQLTGYHKGNFSFWHNPIRNFLRRSGYYSRIADSKAVNSKVTLRRLLSALDKRHETVTYMAPMEYVGFEQIDLRFQAFSIQKFRKAQLDHIFNIELNKLYFPSSVIDTAALSAYWFVVVKERRVIRPLGRIPFELGSFGKVGVKYSPFPILENAFQRLALFDWQPDYSRSRKPSERPEWQGWLGFKIPFVIRISDNLLKAPQRAPNLSGLATEPYFDPVTNEELGEKPAQYINLNRLEAQDLARFIKETDRLINSITLAEEIWPFIFRALRFQVKGFFTEGLEQLLWNITVLEALFGEDRPGITKRLAERTAAVTSQSEVERKEIKNRFEELYNFRSRLVHGDDFKKQVWGKHLREARDMSRQSLLWVLNLANRVLLANRGKARSTLPTRNQLLALIDLSLGPAAITKIEKIIRTLPPTFPTILSWTDSK